MEREFNTIGGQYFKSTIMTPERTKVAFASQRHHELIAYIYDININNFTLIETVKSEDCDCEPNDINIQKEKYFFIIVFQKIIQLIQEDI